MTDRIQNLVDAGRLSRDPADDDEIAGLWSNAVQAFHDAQVDSVSANDRFPRGCTTSAKRIGFTPNLQSGGSGRSLSF